MKQQCAELLGLALCVMPGLVFAQGDPGSSGATTQALATMDETYTEGHPDVINEFAGMRRYASGDYQGAMKYFLLGARYADKPSQLSIGLMYLNGQGVQRDPVTAYAWIAIAAERNYSQFVATRDDVWARLDSRQRKEAKALEQSLYEEYGDPAAKSRMVQAMRDSQTSMTGAGLGYGAGASLYTYTGQKSCAQDNVNECTDLYAKWFWDPQQYFAGRDAAWKGTVTLGPLERAGGTPNRVNRTTSSNSGQP